MEKTRRSIEEVTLENIATLIEHCRVNSIPETSTKDVASVQYCASTKEPTPQQLIESLYHTCIALDKDAQYLYALLARAEHKLRWHEDREIKQAAERKAIAKLLANANQTITTLVDIIAIKESKHPKT